MEKCTNISFLEEWIQNPKLCSSTTTGAHIDLGIHICTPYPYDHLREGGMVDIFYH